MVVAGSGPGAGGAAPQVETREEEVLAFCYAVWLVDLKTGELKQLTHDPARSEMHLDLSAGGRWLAYVSSVRPEGEERSQFTMHKMDLETKEATQLTDTGSDTRPRWSPDATRLAYSHRGAIWVMNADGSGKREIKGRAVVSPGMWFREWSPDGRYILFHSRGDLYAVEVETRALVPLTRGAQIQDDRTVRLSPDGKRVLFCKGDQIHVLELDWSQAKSAPKPD
jgi:Tol biopolymer transport system component